MTRWVLTFSLSPRHFNAVGISVKEDILELLVQGQCLILWMSGLLHTCIKLCGMLLMPHSVWSNVCFSSSCFCAVVNGLSVSLPSLLLSTSPSAVDRKQQLNAVKMAVFMLCKLSEHLESDSYMQSIVTAPSKVWLHRYVLGVSTEQISSTGLVAITIYICIHNCIVVYHLLLVLQLVAVVYILAPSWGSPFGKSFGWFL